MVPCMHCETNLNQMFYHCLGPLCTHSSPALVQPYVMQLSWVVWFGSSEVWSPTAPTGYICICWCTCSMYKFQRRDAEVIGLWDDSSLNLLPWWRCWGPQLEVIPASISDVMMPINVVEDIGCGEGSIAKVVDHNYIHLWRVLFICSLG